MAAAREAPPVFEGGKDCKANLAAPTRNPYESELLLDRVAAVRDRSGTSWRPGSAPRARWRRPPQEA